jgi:hypothetical protein
VLANCLLHPLACVYIPLSVRLFVLGESLAELHHGSQSPVAPRPEGALLLLCVIAASFRWAPADNTASYHPQCLISSPHITTSRCLLELVDVVCEVASAFLLLLTSFLRIFDVLRGSVCYGQQRYEPQCLIDNSNWKGSYYLDLLHTSSQIQIVLHQFHELNPR